MSSHETSEQRIQELIESSEPVPALVAVFDSSEAAENAAKQIKLSNTLVHRVNLQDSSAEHAVPDIQFDHVVEVDSNQVAHGVMRGSLIGAGTGLVFMAVPGLAIAAPIAGALAGAWIGGISAIDETDRGIQLPDREAYEKMLSEGKSLIVITGERNVRLKYEKEMEKLGATDTYQHPPIFDAGFHKAHREDHTVVSPEENTKTD